MKNLPILLIIFSSFLISNCGEPCDDVVCKHNGVCESGDCICEDRYTGKTCELEIVPSSVKIQSFTIHTHEIKPNGDPWDNELGNEAMPDIYITILDSENNLFRTTENFVAPNISKSTISFEIEITDVTKTYTLFVYDEDGAIDDLVYEFPFVPYTSGLNFPSNISKIYSADNIVPTENGELTINMVYCFPN